MRDPKADRPAEQRPNGLASQGPSRADRGAARTLDEQQADGGLGPNHQLLPEPEEHARPEKAGEGLREERRGRHREPVPRAGGEATSEAGKGANVVQPPTPDIPGNLPSEGLFTFGELVLAVVAASAVFLALRWVLAGLAGEIALPQAVVAHPSFFALAAGATVGARLWSARRAKRLNKARHLRGELPT